VSDFHQYGTVATLHRLRPIDVRILEEQLCDEKSARPIALVLPCLISELTRPALAHIVEVLKDAEYISRIVISLGRATWSQYLFAQEFFKDLKQPTTILWIESPKVQSLLQELAGNGLSIGGPGKGRASWLAFGYVLALQSFEVIALHDCDIVTYDRDLLVRLCYPVGNPAMGYEFAKGYYSRVSDRLHGRVTRLFFTPLLRSLTRVTGPQPLLSFLDSFRYPLAGEFAMATDLARVNRIPGDWGLEVGVLSEVYRNLAERRVCQVDISDRYEHKHQTLDPHDAGAGLFKMAIDIAKNLFRNLAVEGCVLSSAEFRTLTIAYVRSAEEAIARYAGDSAINNLPFDRHDESRSVDTFARALRMAADQFLEDPLGVPLIPNWNRVDSALPDFLDRWREAIDGEEARARAAIAAGEHGVLIETAGEAS
jgi:glucosyl-3-phosphoglycerate synthase